MAVYKLFPIQDATIYSEYNTTNTGMDAILELSKYRSLNYPTESTAARALIKFNPSDLSSVLSNYIGTSSYSASLKLYLCDAIQIPATYSVQAHALYNDWAMGTGLYGDYPISTDGVSWVSSATGSAWQTGSYSIGTTGSYTTDNPGGGVWYTGSVVTQSFGPYIDKDIYLDVTAMVSGGLATNGFILSVNDEFIPDTSFTLKYFSRDTHTIYPPCLEVKWDDSNYLQNNSLNICSNGNINISLQNNKQTYAEGSIQKFRVNVRDRFPARVFTTGSMYTVQQILPTSSYWSLIDHKSEDVVIGFDTNFTKISADSTGNYFTVYMEGLEPARYYRILIKSVINGETIVFDDNYIFKIDL